MRTPTWSRSPLFAADEPPSGAPPEEPFMPPPGAIPEAAPALEAEPGDVVVLVGTTKGLFALTAGPDRRGWVHSGPWFPGGGGRRGHARHPRRP